MSVTVKVYDMAGERLGELDLDQAPGPGDTLEVDGTPFRVAGVVVASPELCSINVAPI